MLPDNLEFIFSLTATTSKHYMKLDITGLKPSQFCGSLHFYLLRVLHAVVLVLSRLSQTTISLNFYHELSVLRSEEQLCQSQPSLNSTRS